MSDQKTAAPTASTREAYRAALLALLPAYPALMCIDTDTGLFGADFATAAGSRYVNLGIAEASLMGTAAGLATCGWMPFANTMAAFAAARALEAVKVDIAYNALPVRIMATHGGLSAGHLGPTHHALDDLAVMRILPNMTVIVPGDAAATAAAVEELVERPGPAYVRLGRKATAPLPVAEPPRIGHAQVLREGPDAVLVACGPDPVLAAFGAAELLAADGVRATVLNMHTVAPLDVRTLTPLARGAGLVVTVEEHWRSGGLGGAVAEALAETAGVRTVRLGVAEGFVDVVGDPRQLLEHYGITPHAVAGAVLRALADT